MLTSEGNGYDAKKLEEAPKSQQRHEWLDSEIYLENIQMTVLQPPPASGMDPTLGLLPPDVRTVLLSACWRDPQLAHRDIRVLLSPFWSTGLRESAQMAAPIAAMYQAWYVCVQFPAHGLTEASCPR